MAAVVQLLLVLALLVVGHSQGQSEDISGLVDNNTLTEWGRFTGTSSQVLSQGLGPNERQFLFSGLRFRCSGNVTKWIVGAAYGGISRRRHPALGIYRDQTGCGFADRVGATVLMQSNAIPTRVYEFTPDPPLPFQTSDSLGIYLPPGNDLRLRPLHRRVTGAPASRNYVPSNPPAEGVSAFNFTSAPTEETDRLPLLAVEIESDDPDSAECTRDFISRDLLELLTYVLRRPTSQQIVFTSSNFTSDGNITSWTVAADWVYGAGRTRFPELQIWRRVSGNTYDRIASTELTATGESPNKLYSGTIDPPLQFQSGDLLGMYIPPNADGGARLLVYFGDEAGSTYEFRRNINAPLSSIILTGLETNSDNDRPFLSLETRLEMPPTAAGTTVTTASTQSTFSVDTAHSLSIPKAIGGMVGTFIGGVAVGAVTVLIIVAAVACAKKNQNPKDRSVGAYDMTATTAEAMYDSPYQHETTATSTKRNEASATTAMTTAPNEAYGTTAVTIAPNEAYATTRDGDATATVEYEYI